ncbi:DUF3108 domain-containing protein [Variovorax sp. RHLX14]|uniref:DUF3108 domain-containing protein n=1 Tax=Variovorax sp. RHLX14 TaxID=1259731 RepID=UPI003F468A37
MTPSSPTVSDSAALPTPANRRASWMPIAVLTAVVVLVHGMLLGAVPMIAGPGPSPVTARFETRTIVAAAPTLPLQPVMPAVTSKPTPPKAVPTPTAKPKPKPVAAPVSAPAEALSDAGTKAPAPAESALPANTGETALAPAAEQVATPAAPLSAPAPAQAEASAPIPLALDVPRSVNLKFNVSGQQGAVPLQGVMGELAWSQDGNAYDARLTLRFLFKTLRTQHSSGAIGPTGIEPTRFSDTRKTEVASHFVRDQGQVVFSSNAPPVALMSGAQDRLSVMLQLGALLAGDPARYQANGAIAVQTVGPRDADIWIFKIGDEEKLDLPTGELTARKLTRNPRVPFDDTVELWLAPAYGYLPVRIKITQPGGDFADMQLRNIEGGS